jgi:hypothetical protein
MGRKSNKQRIKDQLDEAITIGQLIELLKDMPADTYIGRAGHFGEACLMDKYAFSHIREVYVTPSGYWRDNKEHYIRMLDLHVPDIGPDPD